MLKTLLRWAIEIRTYLFVLKVGGILRASKGFFQKDPVVLAVHAKDVPFPVYLRVPSSDVNAFEQVFLNKEYIFGVSRSPEFIVDAGANIGLASVCFANEFPNARILAIEPEAKNFEMLAKNVAQYPNVIPVRGALWSDSTQAVVVDPGLGSWGFRIDKHPGTEVESVTTDQSVQCLTIDSILSEHNLDQISVLKMDIEGGELDVLRKSGPWIDRVDSLVIELHERFMPGCTRVFYNATNGFDREWSKGELIYVTRANGFLKPETA